MEFHEKYSMEILLKIFHGIPRQQKHKFHEHSMELHVEYFIKLPCNTTGLHWVFICFQPSGIAMENVFHGTVWFKLTVTETDSFH